MSDLEKIFHIDLDSSINSGQVFLWKKIGPKWYGINGDNILIFDKNTIHQKSDKPSFDFLRLNDDFIKILQSLKKDRIVHNAVNLYPGLRLFRQDPYQCLISFLVSSNSNIQKIQSCLHNLCNKFGERKIVDGVDFFLFPEPDALAKASVSEIQKCGLGYRSKSVKNASVLVKNEEVDFEFLKEEDYFSAKKRLKEISGIGNKVADCILLFSLEKLEAFPLDRWMLRVLEKYYVKKFHISTKTLTEKTYQSLHNDVVDHFGCYAGYAQQFLFKMERELNEKKWL